METQMPSTCMQQSTCKQDTHATRFFSHDHRWCSKNMERFGCSMQKNAWLARTARHTKVSLRTCRKRGKCWDTFKNLNMFDKQPAGHPVAFLNKWVSHTQHINQ